MRTIKFRAWDKKNKEMIVSPRLFNLDNYGRVLAGVPLVDTKYPMLKRCIFVDWELMQYTGLKDKNGIEIYEGDIIKCLDDYNATVEYNSDKAEFDPFGSGENREWGSGVEIIGNIYENSKLI